MVTTAKDQTTTRSSFSMHHKNTHARFASLFPSSNLWTRAQPTPDFFDIRLVASGLFILQNFKGYAQQPLARKSEYGEGTLYWALVSQKGQRKILGFVLFVG